MLLSKAVISRLLIITVVVMISVTPILSVSKCIQLIINYEIDGNTTDPYNPIHNNGEGLNDLGKFDTCFRENNPRNENHKYGVLISESQIKHYNYPDNYLGICLPEICNNTEAYNFAVTKVKRSFYKVYTDGIYVDYDSENSKARTLEDLDWIAIGFICCFGLFATGLIPLSIYLYKSSCELLRKEDKQIKIEDSNDNNDPNNKEQLLSKEKSKENNNAESATEQINNKQNCLSKKS